jgi:hypothetical protein
MELAYYGRSDPSSQGRQPEFSEMPSPLTIESAGRCQKLTEGSEESTGRDVTKASASAASNRPWKGYGSGVWDNFPNPAIRRSSLPYRKCFSSMGCERARPATQKSACLTGGPTFFHSAPMETHVCSASDSVPMPRRTKSDFQLTPNPWAFSPQGDHLASHCDESKIDRAPYKLFKNRQFTIVARSRAATSGMKIGATAGGTFKLRRVIWRIWSKVWQT